MARRSQLEGRLLAILDSGVKRRAPGRLAALAAMLLAVAAVAPFAAMRAQPPAQPAAPPKVNDNVGLVKLGDEARQQGRVNEAFGYYKQAVETLGDRPETAEAILYLGTTMFGKNPTQALDYFQRAQNVAPSGSVAGRAMTWQAFVRQIQDDGAATAESRYRAALVVEEVNSPDAALTMEFLARFLREQGRVGEADALETSAREIRKAHVAQLSPKMQAAAEASKIGNGVTSPTLLRKIEPSYSPEARAVKAQGTVVLTVVIGTDGKAGDVRLSQGVGFGLDEQALDAVTQWSFAPGTRDGMAVPVKASIEVNFRLS